MYRIPLATVMYYESQHVAEYRQLKIHRSRSINMPSESDASEAELPTTSILG